MRPAPTAIAGGVLVVMLAGCSGSGSDTSTASSGDAAPTESTAASPSGSPSASPKGVDATKLIKNYFRALASGNPDDIRSAGRKTTVPGSLAAAYAIEQAGARDASIDGGTENTPDKTTTLGNGDVRLCQTDDDGNTCYHYGHFKVSPEGRLAAFTINNHPLKGRIIVGKGFKHKTPLGSVTLIGAYVTQAGALAVVTKVETDDSNIIYGQNGSVYREPSRRQRAALAGQFDGPGQISAHSQATTTVYFQGPIKLGGDVTIT